MTKICITSSVHGFSLYQAKRVELKDMAHGGFLGPVNIQTRNFGRGPIGWSMGGTPAARDKMMSIIRGFLRK
jgi:hypothetical protein